MQYSFLKKFNDWLTRIVSVPGDSPETLVQKKIWWLFVTAGFFLLWGLYFYFKDHFGPEFKILNLIFIGGTFVFLVTFHLHKKGIEWYAFFTQIFIVLISTAKVYALGGLLNAGAPIFIGLIGPIYALILPNKKRAIFVFVLYMTLMTAATLLQPEKSEYYSTAFYFAGFYLGITQLFFALYYFTRKVENMKREEERRMQELDAFKTKFYTHITHEFRTPITVILGMAEQVKNDPEKWFDESLEMINRNGLKLLNLTNQMLELSKLDAKVVPVNMVQNDIAVYLQYLVESFGSLARSKEIKLSFIVRPDEIIMDYDPEKIQKILSNLLSNAIKFTPPGGRVDISAIKQGVTPKSRLVLTVKDTGPGISKEDIPKVFERYYQVERKENGLEEGTGLGLALVSELVKLFKGEVIVKSNIGKGATFIVSLPVSNQARFEKVKLLGKKEVSVSRYEQTAFEEWALGDSTDYQLLLLIVEDNPDVVQYLRSVLEGKYRIEVAENGQAGFEKATDLIPDLIVSDVMMPVMDGLAFCEKIRADFRTSHIPVILLTAKVDAASKVEGLTSGADVYLAKPFNKEELLIRIQKLIELRKILQERYKIKVVSQAEEEVVSGNSYEMEDGFMQKVRLALENHLSDEEFGIDELCRSLALSRSQLYRKFKALTDTTVHHFIRHLRLVKAKELLLTTELNVSEVAMETGFKALSHFSRVFLEEFGMAPSQVRKKK